MRIDAERSRDTQTSLDRLLGSFRIPHNDRGEHPYLWYLYLEYVHASNPLLTGSDPRSTSGRVRCVRAANSRLQPRLDHSRVVHVDGSHWCHVDQRDGERRFGVAAFVSTEVRGCAGQGGNCDRDACGDSG
jgi:hypothetical protein